MAFITGEESVKKASFISSNDIYEFYVDGSFNPNKNLVGYGVVLIKNGEIILRDLGSSHPREDTHSRNVLGEIKGAIKAMDIAVSNGLDDIIIYYDYLGIEKWAKGEWRAGIDISRYYVEVFKERSRYVNIKFVKVKAHSGNHMNEEADRLSKIASDILSPKNK